jgi:hypothetical protein
VAASPLSKDNWSAPQTVTITGVDDTAIDGNKVYSIITSAATSSDMTFHNVDPADVSVTNVDDESAGFTISPDKGLMTSESGGEATFTVVLNTAPKGNVTITLASSDASEGKIAPLMMTFTPAELALAADGDGDGSQRRSPGRATAVQDRPVAGGQSYGFDLRQGRSR